MLRMFSTLSKALPQATKHPPQENEGSTLLGFASLRGAGNVVPWLHACGGIRLLRYSVFVSSNSAYNPQPRSAPGVSGGGNLDARTLVMAQRLWCVMGHASPAHVHPGAAGAGRDGALRGRWVQAPQESAAQGRLQTRRCSIGHSAPAAVAGDGLRTPAACIRGRLCGGRSQRRGSLVRERAQVSTYVAKPAKTPPRSGFLPSDSVFLTLLPGWWVLGLARLNLAVRLAAAADNNFAELAAVYLTLLRHPINQPITIHTDSMFVLHRVHGLLMPLGCAFDGLLTLRLQAKSPAAERGKRAPFRYSLATVRHARPSKPRRARMSSVEP
jgi:hypothetical protein